MTPQIVVAGGGMAGLCAAVAAASAGAHVRLVEKSQDLGGSMRLSGSLVWTYQDEATVERLVPDGDPMLQSLVVSQLMDDLAWLETLGVEVGREATPRRDSKGREITPSQLISTLARVLEDAGSQVELESGLVSIVQNDHTGEVCGVRLVTGRNGGVERFVPADAVILTTGGFQGNPALVRRYLGVRPDDVQLRSNRWSTGDGLMAAEAVGAATTPGISTFYGHALAAPPAAFAPEHMREATQFYGSRGVAINLSGHRFVDESGGSGEEHVNAALGRQRGGRGFYVVDGRLAGSVAGPGLKIQTTIDRAVGYGAPYVKADTLAELCRQLGDHGVSAANAHGTLTQYNELMGSGRRGDLEPPRSGEAYQLIDPPFQAIGVQAGLTFTMGGIAVDDEMRVLCRAGSSSLMRGPMNGLKDAVSVHIPGLFAAGCDIGGINNGGYMGGLAPALVTGRIAGRQAAGSR